MSDFAAQIRRVGFISAGIGALVVGLLQPATAAAQTGSDLADPPRLLARGESAAESAAPVKGDRILDLNIVYKSGTIYNPVTGAWDNVYLRSYTGTGTDKVAPFVSPTIEARPGETIRVSLNNKLPADISCRSDEAMVNKPHCFNSTNLHSHGLWVNPSGNGDNVLLSVNPGVSFEYEYAIPEEHPAGTFWYHTHRHGSTALQVSSGMAGAIIIRGDREPTDKDPGDLDRLLGDTDERILVFQQIQYACRNAGGPNKGKVKTNKDGTYLCEKGDVGAIESYDLFGPGSWPASGRYTTINGNMVPRFSAESGKLERWRLIHAGVRDTISLAFAKYEGRPIGDKLLRSAQMESIVDGGCDDALLSYNLVAADGLTMAKAQATTVATLQPGYRFDALVAFPEPGEYCVLDRSAPSAGTIDPGSGQPTIGTQLLGIVKVTGTPTGGTLEDKLVALAGKNIGEGARKAVIDDLRDGLKLTRFVPHPTIQDSEITGTQEMTFLIDVSAAPNVTFNVGSQDYAPRPYQPDRLDRRLTLGGVDEWTLRSEFVSHPFHIHVNPFQIVEILDPLGRDVTDPANPDNFGQEATDPQYVGLKGVWKDTLWVKSLVNSYPQLNSKDGPPQPAIYTIKVRTRYQRYIGEFVLHCHILDHEDQGMMQNVAVVLPGGSPGSVNAPDGGHGH